MKNAFVSAALGLALVFGSATSEAIMLSINPASQEVSVGDTIGFDIVISGLGNGAAPSLGAYDFNVTFDPFIFIFDTVTFGTDLDMFGLGTLQIIDTPDAGTVNLFELSLDLADDLNDFQPDTFTLATLSFNTLADGDSLIDISNIILGDADGKSLEATTVVGASVTVTGQVNPVPEPASAALLVFGLLGLLLTRRAVR